MCGIFGAVGSKIDGGIIRAMAIANRERGTDSLGFFDNSGKSVKAAEDPMDCLGTAEFSTFINRACSKGWFIAGHTRFATRGKVTRKNAHPFRYGNIIGAHNGMVDAPNRYAVDSQYLIDLLREHAGDYQKALADVSGYWALSWFDGANFYLQAHNNSFYICRANGAWYYSSDDQHLAACVGKRKLTRVNDGMTLRFALNFEGYHKLPPFVLNVKAKPKSTSYTGTRSKSKYKDYYGGYGAASTNACGAGSNDAFGLPARYRTHDYLGHEEYDEADDLCREFGYRSFEDFMEVEGIHSESQAYAMLTDANYSVSKGMWNDKDEFTVGSDEIPF